MRATKPLAELLVPLGSSHLTGLLQHIYSKAIPERDYCICSRSESSSIILGRQDLVMSCEYAVIEQHSAEMILHVIVQRMGQSRGGMSLGS